MTTALSPGYRVARWGYLAFCVAAFVFLIAPILVLVPLSFNAEPYFTFTEGMLRLDPEAWSLRWYRSIFDGDEWTRPILNSLIIGISATVVATVLGAAAALEQRTLPRQMWSGIREEISPTLLAVATFLIVFALLALTTVEWLRRRGGTAGQRVS